MGGEIEIPAVPVGVLVLLQFFAPYAIAIVTNSRWPAAQKKLVAIVVSVLLATVVLAFAWWMGYTLPAWPVLILLGLVVSQASYALVTKDLGADTVQKSVGVGKHEA